MGVGAIVKGVDEKCRLIDESLFEAVLAVVIGAVAVAAAAAAAKNRGKIVGDSLPDVHGRRVRVFSWQVVN